MPNLKTALLAASALCLSAAWSQAALAAAPADLILYHGKIAIVDKAFSIKSAIAVKDGKVLAVGGEEILKTYDAPTKVDLQGKLVTPGFMDTHVHIQGLSHRSIDISKAHSIADIQQMLRDKARELGPGEWITGSGWSEYEMAEKRRPLRADLDAAAPDNPVVLTRAGSHSSVGDSMALALAHIDKTTPNPPDAVYERDDNGELNGVVREHNPWRDMVPRDTLEQSRPGYIARLHDLLKLGITSYMNASIQTDFWPELQAIYRAHGEELPRATVEIGYPGAEKLKAFPYHTGYGDDRLRIGPIGETPVDGGFTGPTAYTLVDYNGTPGFRGRVFFTKEQLQDMVDTSARLGWQMGLHAIGDAAIVMTVDAYDQALKTIPGQDHMGKDRRWYLAHFTIMPPEPTMKTMAADGIAIAQQPNFSYSLVQRYIETLDTWRVDHNNSIVTPLKEGVVVTFGSDNIPVGPMVGLYGAITRKGADGVVHGASEGVSRAEAIRLYTAADPYLSWEEDKKGTLEPGKFADMVVLDHDLLTVPEDQILKTRVLMTYVGGKLVYDRAKDPAGDVDPKIQ